MSVFGRSNTPSSTGRRRTDLVSQTLRSPSLMTRSHQSHRPSKNSLSHVNTKCVHLWFPGKGIRNMTPRVSGMFYSTRLRISLVWWKFPHNFASNKLLRWIEYGVKMKFKKSLPFRNLRRRNSSTLKVWILRFKIFSRADELSHIKTLLRGTSSSSPDQGFTLLRVRANNASCMSSTVITKQRSSFKRPTKIFSCSNPSSDHRTS